MHDRPKSHLRKIIQRLEESTIDPMSDQELRDEIRSVVHQHSDYLTPIECMNIGMTAEYHHNGHRDASLLRALVES